MQLRQLLAHAKDSKPANLPMTRHGLKLNVEYPRGTQRTLYNDDGKQVYSVHMHNHYGFIQNTKGRDGDEVDCIIGPVKNAKEIYIVWMVDKGPDKDQREDEDKVMIGFPTADAAKRAFLLHYPKEFYGGMTALPVAIFLKKLATAQLPHRNKKLTAKGTRKEGAEEANQSTGSAAHTEHIGTGRPNGAGRAVLSEKKACPKCGSTEWGLLPPDFETKRCADCGKVFE